MPAKKFGSQLDLQKIPVVGLVPESSAGQPASPVPGQLWLDTSLTPPRLKVYENGAFVLVSDTGVEFTANKGTANGYAGLDASTKVPVAQLPTGTTASTVALGSDTRIVNAEQVGNKGVASGYASLDGTTKVPYAQLPTGTAASTIAAGDDSRITGAQQTSGKGVANGYAGLDGTTRLLSGNLPLALPAAGLTGAAAASRYVGATASGAPTSGSFVVGDFVVDQTGNVWVCTVLGTPGTWVSLFRTGTTANTAAAGNDTRLSDQRVPTDGSVTGGPAGTGVKIAAGTITDVNVNALNKDGGPAVPSLRTLGTGAQQAVSGTDTRLADSRTPTGAAGGSLAGTYPNPTIAASAIGGTEVNANIKDPIATTAGLRTLALSGNSAMPGTARLDQIATASPPTAAVSLNGQQLKGLADPTLPGDAATKNYVDATATGLDVHASVRFASTGPVTVTYNATGGTSARGQITAAPLTVASIDTGTAGNLVAGNRILLKNQSVAAQNGIWVVTTPGAGATGVWDRATDWDQDADVTAGAFAFVEEGATNADSGWVLTTDNPIIVGGASGTGLAFAQFSGAGQILAGNGIAKNGNTISAVGVAGSISVGAGGIAVDAAYAGQGSIVTVGGLTAGSLGAGFTPVVQARGGTGGTDAPSARAALSSIAGSPLPQKYSVDLSGALALAAGVETVITHGLNTLDVQAMFRNVADGYDTILSWRVISVNTIGVTADVAYDGTTQAKTLRAVVMG